MKENFVVHCPFHTLAKKLDVKDFQTALIRVVVADSPEGGRWTKMKLVVCDECQFVWRSRTSANAVTAYHSDRETRDEKKKNEKEKAKEKKVKKLKTASQPST